ncbi:hypothetical protein ACFZAU_20885 [Streptomyces sp. NPDC008238]
MIEIHLARAVLSAIVLRDHSSPDEIDRDIASQGLENIAAELDSMDEAERQEFRRVLSRIAEAEPGDAAYVDELPRLPGW